MSFHLFWKNVASSSISVEYAKSDSESSYIRISAADFHLDHFVIVCQLRNRCFIRNNFQLRPSIINKVNCIDEALLGRLHALDYRHYKKCCQNQYDLAVTQKIMDHLSLYFYF